MDIEAYRRQIDEIDAQIVSLLNSRAQLASKIGELKTQNKSGIYDPERESRVYANIFTFNQGPLTNGALESIYRTIIAVSREIQSYQNHQSLP